MKKTVKSMVDDAMDVITTYSVDDARELHGRDERNVWQWFVHVGFFDRAQPARLGQANRCVNKSRIFSCQ